MCTVNSTDALRETISVVKVSACSSTSSFVLGSTMYFAPSFSEMTEVTRRMTFETVAFPKPNEFDTFSFYPHQLNSTGWRQLEFLQAQASGVL